jgi:hypothetical protein
MISERRLAANRANARRSTGPKTPQGKHAVKNNALQHGLLSRDVHIPGENLDAFNELHDSLRRELNPSGGVECFLVDRMANLCWRLIRVHRMEAALFRQHHCQIDVERRTAAVNSFVQVTQNFLLSGYTTTVITDETAHAKAERELELARAKLDDDDFRITRSFSEDAAGSDTLSKIARYETGLERSLFKFLHELERRQAARRGLSVPIPQAVDVSVNARE